MSHQDRAYEFAWDRCGLGFLVIALGFLAGASMADTPPASESKTQLDSITVEAAREREEVKKQVSLFVTGIARRRYDQSLANWQREIPICFLVGGLPREDGEYMLNRLSQIATSAGAPLAPETKCKPNFFVVVTSEPGNALLKVWTQRDPRFFDSDQDVGGGEIRKFLDDKTPIRAWYNWELYDDSGFRSLSPSPYYASRIRRGAVRNLAAVVVLIDAPRVKDVSFGQLAAYVAMVGLAEIKIDARVSDTPTILQLFSDSAKSAPAGLSKWDEAFLKGLYHTEHFDIGQFADIESAMVQDIAPRR